MAPSPSLLMRPIGDTGLRCPLIHPWVAGVLPDIASPARLQRALGGYRRPIPSGFRRDLVGQTLIRRDAILDATVVKDPMA